MARFATRRRPERESFGRELAAVAAALGQPFMPWQRDVAEVGCEIDPVTGLPAYREVIVTVPRQSGKTTLFLSWQINRCTSPRWSQPQRSAFTAQSGKDARDKWLDELIPLIRGSKVNKLVGQINIGMGNESVLWKTGSLIRLLSTSSSSGHSKTLQQAVLDEIWHDADDRREQGLRPAMVTIPDAQLLVCSTAGTDASVVLNRKVEAGRAAATADLGYGVAYIEYSAPDDWDPYDDESYFGFMPALCPDPPCRCGVADGGWRHTMTLGVVHSERASMSPSEFARAYGNRPTTSMGDHPIGPAAFAACFSDREKPIGRPVFFLDVAPWMRSASIAVAADDGGPPHVELWDHREGAGWLVEAAVGLKERNPAAYWCCEAGGPVTALLPKLAEYGIEPDEFTATDMGRACSHLQQLVADRAVTITEHPALSAALAGAVKRDVGDGMWAWGRRKSSVDISPIMAITGAAWGHAKLAEQAPFFGAWR